jgi:menaquinone-dependent protoporphyrinogen IX oxidase
MKKIIVYGSKYGTAKSYAIELSRKTGISCIEYTQVESLKDFSTIVYLGGLYAGGVLGLKKTLKKYSLSSDQKFICITVGLSDPKVESNVEHIKSSLEKQIPKEIFNHCKCFHLRGGIEYEKLSRVHAIMMKALYKKVKKLPKEKQSEETRELIETYNKNANFVDFKSLDEIIDSL